MFGRIAGDWRGGGFATEVALLALAGLFMGILGPFDTGRLPIDVRTGYWMCCIVGGGAIGVVLDGALARWRPAGVGRTLLAACAMVPPVTVVVLALNHAFLGDAMDAHVIRLALQVFVVSLALMAVRTFVRRRPERVVETRTIVTAPLPEAERAFRQRLSARRRPARLVAVEAQDHYLMVHTSEGTEMIGMRFSDAVEELRLAPGFQVHRSWWVSSDAIRSVRWSRGSGEADLGDGLTVPVSRRFAPILREAGWRS